MVLGFVYCVRGTRTQPVICVGCSVYYWFAVQLIKDCICVDTHLPHFDALTQVVIPLAWAFIFQTFSEICYYLSL